MEPFDVFVSDNRIIDVLCKIRAKAADERNKLHLIKGLAPDFEIKQCSSFLIYSLMPPRRQWLQLNQNSRYKTYSKSDGTKYSQSLNTYDKNLKSLKLTIKRHVDNGSTDPYLTRLKSFVLSVKQAIIDSAYTFKSPETYPESKNKKLHDGRIECRPISSYEDLKDRVIINLANKYLTILFDKYFYDESLAFRAKRKYHSSLELYTSHHNAVDRIQEFRSKHASKNIYVAECDMQKFYDTVSHSVVKQEFKRLLKKAKKEHSGVSFSCIERIFCLYLKSYTFPANVYAYNNLPKYWSEHRIPLGKFEWVENQLISNGIYKNAKAVKKAKIGVPQGGALSGLIANIVLNPVDQNLITNAHKNMLYVRYCDDMILLSTNRKRCSQILKLYTDKIKQLKLIPHVAEADLRFGTKEFWKKKSRDVYKWGNPDGSEWIGFVGYEINRGGDIRIRKASFKKEKNKQVRVIKDLFEHLNERKRLSNGSIERSYANRLIAMSVGRITLWNYSNIQNELCWVNGFEKLNDNKYVTTQVKNLDRCRNRAMYKARKTLQELKHSGIISEPLNDDTQSLVEYYGKPYSYYYHFKKNIDK